MKKAIIGHAAKKFTEKTETAARRVIASILDRGDILVSGGCHLGGIDIWAEEIAKELGCYNPDYIHLPKIHRWEGGYRQRNLKIAKDSDIVHCIVIDEYPPSYDGMKFDYCYHCKATDHIKSGGCWTAWQAVRMGKPAIWHVIAKDGTVTTKEVMG